MAKKKGKGKTSMAPTQGAMPADQMTMPKGKKGKAKKGKMAK